jgi:hypothetical protein
MIVGRIIPATTEITVINASADVVAKNTVKRLCRIARIAAIRKVLSPSSENIIIPKAVAKDVKKLSVTGTSLGDAFDGDLVGIGTSPDVKVGVVMASVTAAAMVAVEDGRSRSVLSIALSAQWEIRKNNKRSKG